MECRIMNKRRVTNYTEEFKQSSARLAAGANEPISKIANELGVHVTTLHGWVKKYYPEKKNTPTLSNVDLESENKQLRKELTRVKMERDILKKAAAYFANEAQ